MSYANTHKRPGPPRAPPVWAETRQELAESLPYYRAYQSGSYVIGPSARSSDLRTAAIKAPDSVTIKDTTSYAYLLGGFGSPRDVWADRGRMIISHGGGHAAVSCADAETIDDDEGNNAKDTLRPGKVPHNRTKSVQPSAPVKTALKLASSQSRHDTSTAGLLSSWQAGTPIVLIMGENYPLADFTLNCGFGALGWYFVTEAWAEKEGEAVRWKFKFEWVRRQGQPWWWSQTVEGRLPYVWNPRVRTEVRARNFSKEDEQRRWADLEVKALRQAALRPQKRSTERIQTLQKRIKLRASGSALRCESPPKEREGAPAPSTSNALRCKCQHCGQMSPQVYSAGWACLVPECHKGFWRFETGAIPDLHACDILPSFLQPGRDEPVLDTGSEDVHQPLSSVAEPLPFSLQASSQSSSTITSAMHDLKGLFCPQCHRLSCREFLAFHRCAHCSFVIVDGPPPLSDGADRPRPPKVSTLEFNLLHDVVVNNRFDIRLSRHIHDDPTSKSSVSFEVSTYSFPPAFLGSRIHVIKPCTSMGKACHGQQSTILGNDAESDAILAQLQASLPSQVASQANEDGPHVPLEDRDELWTSVLKLRRHELTAHRSTAGAHGKKSRLLTQMFTANVGAAYKHSTKTETTSWSEAVPCVLAASDVLEKRTRWVLADPGSAQQGQDESVSTDQSRRRGLFNELYPCYYLEGMKMNYHDDGEPGLGPVVSSLSLGTVPATMSFRLKKKFSDAYQRRSRTDPSQSKSEKDDLGSTAGMDGTPRQVYKDMQRALVSSVIHPPNGRGSGPLTDRVALTIPLTHGSVVVQEGRFLQEVLEHQVSPDWEANRGTGGSRLAVTARWIDSEPLSSG
ncbi:unnamed protein product [Parajaminaea phylloscopi]